jgi:hypothetical protein
MEKVRWNEYSIALEQHIKTISKFTAKLGQMPTAVTKTSTHRKSARCPRYFGVSIVLIKGQGILKTVFALWLR